MSNPNKLREWREVFDERFGVRETSAPFRNIAENIKSFIAETLRQRDALLAWRIGGGKYEEITGDSVAFPSGVVHTAEWKQGYNAALDDVIRTIREDEGNQPALLTTPIEE